jgi:hypothetical protein
MSRPQAKEASMKRCFDLSVRYKAKIAPVTFPKESNGRTSPCSAIQDVLTGFHILDHGKPQQGLGHDVSLGVLKSGREENEQV